MGYIIRRIIYTVLTLLVIATLVFLMIHLTPGDPAATMLGIEAKPEDIEALREVLGLNDPLVEQYFRYIFNIFKGDFGNSIYYKESVFVLFSERFPYTLELTLLALIISTLIGIPLGIISATHRYSVIDNFTSVFSLLGVSIPIFWFGILLMYIFSLKLGWMPVSGRGGPIWTVNGFNHIILPSISLGITMMASTMRLMRSSMLEILNQDYITTARAKGLPERTVIYKDALKNAILPVITNIGLQAGVLLGGSFLTESVFAWPGIGRLAVQAIKRRDFPVIQCVTFIIAALFVLINLIIDLSYMLLDPRIKYT